MIGIIQGCGYNIASLQFAIERLDMPYIISSDPAVIRNTSHVILPGVGHSETAMTRLKVTGFAELIPSLTQPVLGICLGMQLLYEYSEEGNVDCLGVIPGRVKHLMQFSSGSLKVPHMGWNTLQFKSDCLKNKLKENSYCYFVHSYGVENNEYTLATTNYGAPITAITHRDNFYGMQFHPERSGNVGQQLLSNFLRIG